MNMCMGPHKIFGPRAPQSLNPALRTNGFHPFRSQHMPAANFAAYGRFICVAINSLSLNAQPVILLSKVF